MAFTQSPIRNHPRHFLHLSISGGHCTRTTFVANEEATRVHAIVALHHLVEDAIKMLAVEGHFEFPEWTAVVGDLDFSWITAAVTDLQVDRTRKLSLCGDPLLNPLCGSSANRSGRRIC